MHLMGERREYNFNLVLGEKVGFLDAKRSCLASLH